MAHENAKNRIVKNTLFLYGRMALILLVSLYTSRVLLEALGVEDYGIYNVVAGVITMLGFLNASLSGASSRFLIIDIENNGKHHAKETFSSIICINLLLAGAVVLIGETVGLWFVMRKLVIPADKLTEALWVYQFSIFTAVLSILSIPYNALIIAHEKMSAFAYISSLETLLKLGIALILCLLPFDRLVMYGILYFVVQALIRFIYNFYCIRHFDECRTGIHWNGKKIRDILSFAGWIFNSDLAVVGYTQGINILLNIFFGPIVNAARGIAMQLYSAAIMMVANFLLAVRPQIVKAYASDDFHYIRDLVNSSSKYGYFLVMLIVVPGIYLTPSILHIWLTDVPEYTVSFVRILLVRALIEPLKGMLTDAIRATGHVRKFQIYEGAILLSVLPVCYIALKFFGIDPVQVFYIYLALEIIAQCFRIWIVLPEIKMGYGEYIREVMLPVLGVSIISFFPFFLIEIDGGLPVHKLVTYGLAIAIASLAVSFAVGLKSSEKQFIKSMILNKVVKR